MARHLLLLTCALTLSACIPPGGGGGGDDDDDRGVDEADRGAPDPDDGVPPPDGGAPDPDDGIPPPDGSAPDPDDGIPPPDRGVEADQGVTPADRGVEPDEGGCGEERCNGQDDDCDGRFDEDFPTLGQPCSVGQGACRADAAIVCTLDGRGVTCDAVLEAPEDERCNGTDDDCDGRVDEGTAGGACVTGDPGVCGPGALSCVRGGLVCVAEQGPSREVCDGVDDDCDGATDEEGACFEPVEVSCQDGIDNDEDGFVDCRDFDCDDLPECADEVEQNCRDGIDNDGDGFVDCEDFNCDDDPACVRDAIVGVQENVGRAAILARGWRECHRSVFTGNGVGFANIRAACNGAEVMLACGRVGNPTLLLAAEGPAADVFFNVGGGVNVTHAANGVEWYYSPTRSFGFAPFGNAVNLNTCDTLAGTRRMCVHLGVGDVTNEGYRCGENYVNGDNTWERVIYTR
ncbi:MAG: MopE-related protein [bacterium]